MIEKYRLTMTHYAIDTTTGDSFTIDEPFCMEQVFDYGSPILLNRMLDEFNAYALARVERSKDGET